MEKLEKISQKLMQHFPLIFGIFILAMDAIAFAAPILAELGFDGAAHLIYRVYFFLCHQRPWRSIHLFDYQVAWCTRDTFLYLSLGLAGILVSLFKIRNVKWYVAFLSVIPFALDGGIQFIAEIQATMNGELEFFYASTNFFRMLTATIFGAGVGLWLFSMMGEVIEEEANLDSRFKNKDLSKERKKWFLYYLAIILICFVSYLGIVQVWKATSPKYSPAGLLDHKRYYPGVNYEKVGRGGHGV